MIARVLSQRLVLLVIGLAAGSGILIPASYGSFHPVTSSEIEDGTIQSIDIGNGQVKAVDIGGGAVTNAKLANGAVNSAKIADNSITAADIGANAVNSSEIATDAVGADELKGVTKLIFIDCLATINTEISSGTAVGFNCNAPGADTDDNAVASINNNDCFALTRVDSSFNIVSMTVFNRCATSQTVGGFILSIIVYDT